MKNKYKSEAMKVVHEDMKSMHQLGIISDERMSEFDKLCLKKKLEVSEKPIASSLEDEQIVQYG